MTPDFIGVTGLPRAGSTLMCQLLAQHPEIYCEGHSSPLCSTLTSMRRTISDDSFFLAQLDNNFDSVYGHLTSAMKGFLRGWYQDCGKKAVVDKNRGWMLAIELLLQLAPEAKFIVCLRELGQIYGSIEAQHQKTILMDYADHIADVDRFSRASMLFGKDKTVGGPLIALHSLWDLPPEVQKRLYFIRFEDLVEQPGACMASLFDWLGLSPCEFDFDNLKVGVRESDGLYRMKYPHRQFEKLVKPAPHAIPPRIQAQIENGCPWYYQAYYPRVIPGNAAKPAAVEADDSVAGETEKAAEACSL